MPPKTDYLRQNDPKAKTEQNFYKPKTRNDLFNDDFGFAPPRGSTAVDRLRNSHDLIRDKRGADNEDFFVDNSERPATGYQNTQRHEVDLDPRAESRARELEIELKEARHQLEVVRMDKERTVDENNQLRIEMDRLKSKNDDLTDHVGRIKSMHEETIRSKQQHFDDMRSSMETSHKEMRETMQRQCDETVKMLRETYHNDIDTLKKLADKGSKVDMTSIDSRMKHLQADIRSMTVSGDMGYIKDRMGAIADQINDLNDKRESLESEKKELNRRFEDENKHLSTKHRELDELRQRLDQREADLKHKENSLHASVADRETKVRDKEIELERRENRANHTSNLLKREKAELEDIVRRHNDRMANDKRQFEQRVLGLQDKEFETEKKLKHAIERDSDTRLKEEEVSSRLRTIKLREEVVQREKTISDEQLRKVQQERMEIQLFKDNIEIEKSRNLEEHRRLNVFATKLNTELETLNKDRVNVEMMKKTLSSLRMDYTQELIVKQNRDNYLDQDIALIRKESPIDLVTRPVEVTTMAMADRNLNEIPTKKFNFDEYMSRLKYNY